MKHNIKSAFIPSYDGEKLYVERHIASSPTLTLLIIHGLGGDSNATIPFIHAIQKHNPQLECVVYDLRGHGYSSRRISNDVNFETVHTKDLNHLLSFEKKPVHILGHSLGGIIIQKLFELNPDFPHQKLFFVSSHYKSPAITFNRQFWFNKLTQKKWPSVHHKRTVEDHLKYQNTHDFSPSRLHSDCRSMGLQYYFLTQGTQFGWESTNPLFINRDDCYLFYGKDDVFFPQKLQESWLQSLPLTHSQLFPTNHNILVNLPEQLAQAVTTAI